VEPAGLSAWSHGGVATLSSRRGEITAFAKLTETVPPGVLFMPFHFAEGAANALTNNELDPESHIPEFKVSAVRVRGGG